MLIRTKKTNSSTFNEDVKVIERNDSDIDYTKAISKQLTETCDSNTHLLQEIQSGIHLLTVKKSHDMSSLALKKLSDRVQYALLPLHHQNAVFCKLTFNSLKNQCHNQLPASWMLSLANKKGLAGCYIYFYYHLDHIQETLKDLIKDALYVKEILSNRTMILADSEFNYPLPLAKLPALAIWNNHSLALTMANEVNALKTKLSLLKDIFSALKVTYSSSEWSLHNGQMRYTYNGITRSFDYANLLDDILHARYEDRIEEYLSYFHVNDLDTSSTYPTVSVRSPAHLKARPQCLFSLENGYAVVAAKEAFGKQTVITNHTLAPAAFPLWLKRAERHSARHIYKARVIFASDTTQSAFSLVGEQVSTIAIFPALLKGVFETLHLDTPKSVRVVAHNEDVITIAHDTASWTDINAVSQKAAALFRLIANDGSDPLSLFEHVTLPFTGAGNFQMKIVPDQFFELLDTAHTMKHSMPPGHDHYLLGLAYECLHEWGLAVTEFQKALRLDAHDPDILHGLGCALMEIGQTSEAMPFLKRAFDMMPEDPEIANNCGRSSLDCGDIADAIKAFERAVRLSPASADYLKNLGDGYLLAARPTEALAMFNKAIRCDPHLAEAHASLAHLHLAIGDEQQARKHALLAYKENPVDANIANLLWRLTLQKK